MNTAIQDPLPGLWEGIWLPRYAYATDDLTWGVYPTTRGAALKRKYIQTNPQCISNLLVVDIDSSDATLRAVWDRKDWLPNIVTENPLNGHAHAIWVLKTPFSRVEYARRKPVTFANAITEGLRRSVDGDKGYSGFLTKNPVNPAWEAMTFTRQRYEMRYLAGCLETAGFMPPQSWKRTSRRKPVGLSRNCTLFALARPWSYEEMRRIRQRNEYPTPLDRHDLLEAITSHVIEQNCSFSEPLPPAECGCIARSITKWITNESNFWHTSRSQLQKNHQLIQHYRGIKSGAKRRDARAARMMEAQEVLNTCEHP